MKTTSEKFLYDRKLGIVCCYFNPCDYLSRFLNYVIFIENIKKHGVKVLTVEAYTTKSKYRVDKLNNDTISIRTGQTYWMKECLLNVGIKKLLELGYENIAWVDADIIFKSSAWPGRLLKSLSQHKVVQIFEYCFEEITSNISYLHRKSAMSYAARSKTPINDILMRRGELGYGYAYQSEVLKQCLLYDKAIMGTGDFANLVGCYYNVSDQYKIKNDRFFMATTEDFFTDYCEWATKMNNAVNSNVGVCGEDITILNHGNRQKRYYISRENIIKHHSFKPTQDLHKEPTGIYKIHMKQRSMIADIKKQFISRNEDENLSCRHRLASKQNLASKSIKKIFFYDRHTNLLSINSVATYLSNRAHILKTTHANKNPTSISHDKQSLITETELKTPSHPTTNTSSVPLVVVMSRHTNNPVTLDTHTPSVIFAKNGLFHPGECMLPSHRYSVSHTYLSYIINNYDKLPQAIAFINDIEYTQDTQVWIQTLKNTKTYTTYKTNKKRILLDQTGHLEMQDGILRKSKYDFKTWFATTLPAHPPPTHLYKNSIFAVTKKSIQKNKKSFYIDLATAIPTRSQCEEEHYIRCCWRTIFS